MKKFFAFLLLSFWAAGCSNQIPVLQEEEYILISSGQLPVIFSETVSYRHLSCITPGAWYAALEGGDGWCRISPESGRTGMSEIMVQADANRTGSDRSALLVIRSEPFSRSVLITQVASEQITCDKKSYWLETAGGEFELTLRSNVRVHQSFTSALWLSLIEETIPDEIRGVVEQRFRYRATANTLKAPRSVVLVLSGNNKEERVTLSQYGTYLPDPEPEMYESTDYSADGKCVVLQRASEGLGIDIVVLGDAFSDRLIADGTYDKWVSKAVEALFAKEPYKSFRKFFNVYMVCAVSPNESYTQEGAKRALGTFFGEGATVGGNDTKCKQYVMKVPDMTEARLENTLILVLMNCHKYGGVCKMYYPSESNDYGCGTSVAYIPFGTGDEMFEGLVRHEAGGHGFAKLADEYSRDENVDVPQDVVRSANRQVGYGWLKNIDFTSLLSSIKWRGFLVDSRYTGLVGIFEGGYTYQKGVYRPTKSGLMNTNTGEYNAPSRQAIYYRIHKLAYGPAWSYDHERFVTYDEDSRSAAAAAMGASGVPYAFEPLPPPVVCEHPL